MARTKSLEKQVEDGITKLLQTTLAGELNETQTNGAEVRLKVLNTAITYMKVKHKIDEGAGGSALHDDEDFNV